MSRASRAAQARSKQTAKADSKILRELNKPLGHKKSK